MAEEEPREPNEPEGDPPEEPDPKAEVEKWKALARKHEAEAKKNRAAASRLSEIEDANKSEIERATAAAQAAEDRATTAEREVTRLRIATRKGLPENLAARLRGDTEEELEADADELLAIVKGPDQEGGEPDTGIQRRPQERLRPGSRPNAEPKLTSKEIVEKAEALTTL